MKKLLQTLAAIGGFLLSTAVSHGQTSVKTTGATVTSLQYNGVELIPSWQKQTIFAQDQTPGSNNARPAITVSAFCPDGTSVEFDITATMIKDASYTCSKLMISLPSLNIQIPAIGTTQSATGGSGDIPVVPAVTSNGFNFYLLDLNYPVVDMNHPLSGVVWQTGAQQFGLRIGSSNGSAMPINATTYASLKGGQTYTFKFQYRFAPSGSDVYAVNQSYLNQWVQDHIGLGQKWADHRPIGELYVCQSTPTTGNPWGYCQDSKIDVSTAAGVQALQTDMQNLFTNSVNLMKNNANAQGIIVWDITGDSNKTLITQAYVGDPRLLPDTAPQVDAIADACFKTITNAGLRAGVCLRDCCYYYNPQTGKFVPRAYASETERRNELFAKIQYARERWGCTLFYLDSWVGSADTLQFLSWAFPDSLICPESEYPATWYYFYCAPYSAVDLYRDQTPTSVLQYIPWARQFSGATNAKFDGSQRAQEIMAGLAHGDIIGVRAWWNGGDDWKFLNAAKAAGDW